MRKNEAKKTKISKVSGTHEKTHTLSAGSQEIDCLLRQFGTKEPSTNDK
jgi:hypothetical protein